MMQPINKQFYDAWAERYPDGSQVYKDFIDKWKLETAFQFQLKNGVKVHDLPTEVQFGVYVAFYLSRGGCDFEIDIFQFEMVDDIPELYHMLQVECDIENGYDGPARKTPQEWQREVAENLDKAMFKGKKPYRQLIGKTSDFKKEEGNENASL